MSYFGYSPASTTYNTSTSTQVLGSPTSSSGGGMSGSTSPSGLNSNNPSSPPGACCEGSRPLLTDPLTGQSVCSCTYDPSRLSLSSYARLPPPYGGNPYGGPTDQSPYPSLDSSAFYTPLGGAYGGLKEGSGTGDVSCWPNTGSLQSGYYPYDPTFAAAYGYGSGYDLAARRKNASRESTATLKAWLNEHKKNPYPTKGEKIMLAIITKMTLTQVSTWFANARRRLKKENKMTWEPKNKTDDDDEDMKDDEDDCDSSHEAPSPHSLIPNHNNNIIKSDPLTNNRSIGPVGHDSSLIKSDCGQTNSVKPKIWSLADTAACKTPPPVPVQSNLNYHHLNVLNHHHHHHHQFQQHHHPNWGFSIPPYGRPYAGFGLANGDGSDTPPQTPPNLKVPLLPHSLGYQNHPGGGVGSSSHIPPDLTTTPTNSTAFKPVLKGSTGGFCV